MQRRDRETDPAAFTAIDLLLSSIRGLTLHSPLVNPHPLPIVTNDP